MDKLKLISAILGEGDCFSSTEPKKHTTADGEIRIVILQRGWVVVGRVFQSGVELRVENGYVVRVWGTSKGLGEIATNGPTEKTILDPIPTLIAHEGSVIAQIQCSEFWRARCSVK